MKYHVKHRFKRVTKLKRLGSNPWKSKTCCLQRENTRYRDGRGKKIKGKNIEREN